MTDARDLPVPPSPPRLLVTPEVGVRRLRPAPLLYPISPLAGREAELAALRQLVVDRASRLITILGPGGVGKSRLALELAHEIAVAGEFNAISFTCLAGATDVAHIPGLIAAIPPGESAAVQFSEDDLVDGIGESSFLLIVDNLEHLPGAGQWIAQLLARCPGLLVIAVSRAKLRVYGETVFELGALSLPPETDFVTPQQIIESSAGRLLLQRVQAVQPDFQVTEANAPVLASICHRLEGLPLSIELAARYLRVVSPLNLLARLDHQLTVLTGGPFNVPPRLQSMRASVDWSIQILGESDRQALARLAVFAGGFTLEAAETMLLAGREDEDTAYCVAVLVSLQNQSLLTMSWDGDEPRFSMLAPIREAALELLAQAGVERAVRSAHASWVAQMAANLFAYRSTPEPEIRRKAMGRELPNIRQALQWMFDHDDALRAEQVVSDCGDLWWSLNHLAEGLALYQRLFAATPGLPTIQRARNLAWASLFASARNQIALARRLAAEGITLAEALGDYEVMTVTCSFGGQVASYAFQHAEAVEIQTRAVAAAEKSCSVAAKALAFTSLATAELRLGMLQEAALHATTALPMAYAEHNKRQAMFNLVTLSHVALAGANQKDFHYYAPLAFEACKELEDQGFIAESLVIAACFAASHKQYETSARMLAAADRMRDLSGRWHFRHQTQYTALLEELRLAVDPFALQAAFATGAILPIELSMNEAASMLVHGFGDDDAQAECLRYGLSGREQEVLALLAEGLTDRQIAAHMGIAEKTASNHVSSILTKLGVQSRSSAAVEGYRIGIAGAAIS